MLRTEFVPVALDQAYHRRQKDNEGEFYRKIASQGPRSNWNSTTQGLYMATAGGEFLGYNNNRGPERIRGMMKKTLEDFEPKETTPLEHGEIDPRVAPQPPPEGGLIIAVRAKILDGYEATDDKWRKLFQQAVSRDNLWLTAAEHQALMKGEISDRVAKRIVRFHLVDNTRGEPTMWRDDEIRKLDLRIADITESGAKITGDVHVESKDGERGYQAKLAGSFAHDGKQVTEFQMAAQGDYWGEGRYTRGAPKGKFPLVVTFSLISGEDPADRIQPQGSRHWVKGYLEN